MGRGVVRHTNRYEIKRLIKKIIIIIIFLNTFYYIENAVGKK